VTRREALVLLAVLSTGVFLAGLELMVTAVALPSIVTDLASWQELRLASWIVNAYLLVYVVTMPIAGRLADAWGARRMYLAALAVFILGSIASGSAQSLAWLIAGRCVQAVGGGALVPVATAAASHLFHGHDRPRALGVIGALTFLGMAAGPFVGAAVLETVRIQPALAAQGIVGGPLLDFLAPSWRWVFYVNVPIGLVVLAVGWAASADWETPRRPTRIDLPGAALLSVALATGLAGITLIDDSLTSRFADPTYPPVPLLLVAIAAAVLAVRHGLRTRDPFLDPRLFRDRVFASAAVVSLLTGYAFATAILGGAIFVDRVLYGGPDSQRVVLGALAAATALGALSAGFVVRRLSLRLVTVVGLAGAAAALLWASTWTPAVALGALAGGLAVFGLGFGLTVTPRSTAAVEAVGRSAYGMASATVTVARMIGMAIGLAVLTAYGSTTIERLSAEVYASPEAYLRYIPAELRDRPLKDPLVVDALERWAAGEAAGVMASVFVVAGAVTIVAIPPGLALRPRTRILSDGASERPSDGGLGSDGRTDGDADEPAFAL
jgi:EmrB/QacA subfamily drug resistance transporter